jgi:hypothetical protein
LESEKISWKGEGARGGGGDQWRSVRIYLRITDMYFIYDETDMRITDMYFIYDETDMRT